MEPKEIEKTEKAERFAAQYMQIKAEIAEMGLELAQADDEFTGFLYFISEHKPRRVLEIGAREGASIYAMARVLPVETQIVAVDLPNAAWGRAGSEVKLALAMHQLNQRGYDATPVFGDSREERTHHSVTQFFGGLKPDLVFIDGNHSYGGVLADWEKYGVGTALVAFHDILESPSRPKVKVHLLWRVLKTIYPTVEFLGARAKNEGVFGIGLLTNVNPLK